MNQPLYKAPGVHLIGDITFGEQCSVFYNAVIRADEAPVHIGDRVNIQDLCVLHVGPSSPLVIGNDVTVGHGAILHGCTIDDRVIIGMGSIILNNAHIPSDCVVGAGSLVTEGKNFPEKSLILGSPARAVRTLTGEELRGILRNAEIYVELAEQEAEK